jgi:hypothetical protein
MNRDIWKNHLLSGGSISVCNTWTFEKCYMTCSGSEDDYICCDESYSNIDETLDAIEMLDYSNGDEIILND